jgi:hypothetical protein
MLLVFAAAILDVWSTNRALASGGAKEANPLMAFFMRLLGSKWVLARLLFAQLNIYFVMSNPVSREGYVGLLAFGFNVALMTWVIWNNIRIGDKQTRQ